MIDPVTWRSAQSPLQILLRDARTFIADVTDEIDPASMDDCAVMHTVRRMCEGGWAGFVFSDQSISPERIKTEITQTFGQSFAFHLYK